MFIVRHPVAVLFLIMFLFYTVAGVYLLTTPERIFYAAVQLEDK